MDYLLHVLITVSVYSVLAVSLDLLAGHTGLASVSQAGFFGVGAYASALLSIHAGTPFAVNLVLAMLFAAAVSMVVSLPSLRLHDDYFVVATFAFQMILFSLMNNWRELTRGPFGLSGIPRPVLFGWQVDSTGEYLVMALVLAAVAFLVVQRIAGSPAGRVLRAIREDEVFAQSLGKNTVHYKVVAFGISGALAASAGSFQAHYVTYIDPTGFTLVESILIVSMVVIGGAGRPFGALVGAFVLVTLPELLRAIGLPAAIAANVQQVIYGALLVVMMLFRPTGLVGRFGFGR